MRKFDSEIKKSDFKKCLNRNHINRINKIYGKKLIYKLLRYYQNENKY